MARRDTAEVARGERGAERRSRLDLLLVRRGLFATREKAQSAIMAGEVIVDGMRQDKPGAMVAPSARVEVRPSGDQYVSRAGKKLEKALVEFGIDVSDKVAIDVGASTGGFTDCLLRHGAKRVYAIDVGYGQLAWELRQDPRIVVLERTNVRYLDPGAVPEKADVCTIDVSFISITKFLRHLLTFLADGAALIVLVKPQFEAGREQVRKGGVVRDPAVHAKTLTRIIGFMAEAGMQVRGLTYSPMKGPAGNIEFLVYAVKGEQASGTSLTDEDVSRMVDAAHRDLG